MKPWLARVRAHRGVAALLSAAARRRSSHRAAIRKFLTMTSATSTLPLLAAELTGHDQAGGRHGYDVVNQHVRRPHDDRPAATDVVAARRLADHHGPRRRRVRRGIRPHR